MLKQIGKVLEKPICDNCLGRIYAQLLSGYTNAERGKIIRKFLAFAIDAGKIDSKKYARSGRDVPISGIDASNFYGFTFRQNKDLKKKLGKENIGAKRNCRANIKKIGAHGKISEGADIKNLCAKKSVPRLYEKCYYCDDFFSEKNMDKLAKKIISDLKKYEFRTFVIGTKVSNKLIEKEEELWEQGTIDYCEPIRAEINREVGKKIGKLMKKETNLLNPDITVLLDMQKNKIELTINSLYIFGYYNKLKTGFPQCRWGTPGKYKTSVEQIIAKPAMRLSKGKDHRFHGAGREDISARCLGWRAFVLEIQEPLKRKIDLKKVEREIKKTKKVEVKGLKFSNMETIRRIKAATPDKTYRAVVVLDKNIFKKISSHGKKYARSNLCRAYIKKELNKLKKLKGTIFQKTPERVLHRRADLLRKRIVKSIKYKLLGPKKLELIIKGTAGLYIKELISGDNGRTKPSVSEILGVKAVCKELDVVNIGKIR